VKSLFVYIIEGKGTSQANHINIFFGCNATCRQNH